MTAPGDSPEDAGQLTPAPRWVAPVFAVLGAATIPWTTYLAVSLPDQAHTHSYRVAWVGFDIMLVLILLSTAYAAWRGRPLVGLLAASTATMLVVDAWFDVTTSRRSEVPWAALSALLVELPLAVVCGWIALHVDQVIERRLRLLARRAQRLPAGSRSAATARAGVRVARHEAATAQRVGRIAHATGDEAQRTIDAAQRTIDEAEGRR